MNQVFQNEEQEKSFKEKGYLVIKNFLLPEMVQSLKGLYLNNIPENPKGFHRSLDYLDKDYKKKLSDGINKIVTPVSEQFLKDYRFLLVSYMIKEKGEETAFELHQNWNFVDESQYHSLAIWIPLVDVDATNGTMHVVEGSHRMLPTFRGGPKIPSIYRNIYDYIKENHMKPIPLKAGDALIIDDAILHYTSANLSDAPRMAIAQVMIPKAAKPIYYYQAYGDENAALEKYQIDDDFYLYFNNRYTPENPPHDCELIQRFTTSLKPIDSKEFDALIQGDMVMESTVKELPIKEIQTSMDENESSENKKENLSFFEVYSPRNIAKEILYRLGMYDAFFSDNKNKKNKKEKENDLPEKTKIHPNHPQHVGAFYDKQHDAFIKVYGDVIQAFRTKDVSVLLNQQVAQIGLEDGQKVLDAGCGICAPAIHFAKAKNIKIEAITISKKQSVEAKKNIAENNLDEKINVTLGDYHQLENHFPENHFDKVYFLESFGHSHDKKTLLKSVWNVLKPGGQVYIKDLFRKVSHSSKLQKRIDTEIWKINDAYHYHVADLNEFLDIARQQGYIIEFVKTIDFPLSEFEDLAISNDFQELTGIGKIENWAEYIFPIDFFEVRLMKAQVDLGKGMDRYFLQNLYRLQIENWKEENL